MIWSLERRSNRLKTFGLNDAIQVIGMVIKFIGDDETLGKLLILNKDCYDTLRKAVYKQALLRSSQERLKMKRMDLWVRILDIPHNREASVLLEKDYEYHLKLTERPEYLPKLVSDAIEVDVARSFNHLKQITP